jgi:quinol monooxygenase YgiN
MFRMRAKPGDRQKIIDHFDLWLRDRRPEAPGFVRTVLCSSIKDPDEFIGYAMFADKKTYDDNSNSPEQDAWYRELRAHLTDDPDWFDATLERQRMG